MHLCLQSYRGRKPNGPITPLGAGGLPTVETNGGPVAPTQQPTARPSPQPVTQPMPVQQQPMVSFGNSRFKSLFLMVMSRTFCLFLPINLCSPS